MPKSVYGTKRVGEQPFRIEVMQYFEDPNATPDPITGEKIRIEERVFRKVADLRYGTNPRQTAAYYGPASLLGSLQELKTGKEGLSQTNLEDIFYALDTIKWFERPSAAIMKHENICGGAVQNNNEPLRQVYAKANGCDYQAAFGGVVGFNTVVDKETADSIMQRLIEVVAAPEFEEGVMDIFSTGEKNKNIRVVKFDAEYFRKLPKFVGDDFEPEMRIIGRTLIRYDPYLSGIKSAEDLMQYVVTERKPNEQELKDLLTAWRFCINLRSNASVFVKDGYVRALGYGQPDRVTTIRLAVDKHKLLHKTLKGVNSEPNIDFSLDDSIIATDGFFPKLDGYIAAVGAGAGAIILPRGGLKTEQDAILEKANLHGVSIVKLPEEERCFSHH